MWEWQTYSYFITFLLCFNTMNFIMNFQNYREIEMKMNRIQLRLTELEDTINSVFVCDDNS